MKTLHSLQIFPEEDLLVLAGLLQDPDIRSIHYWPNRPRYKRFRVKSKWRYTFQAVSVWAFGNWKKYGEHVVLSQPFPPRIKVLYEPLKPV